METFWVSLQKLVNSHDIVIDRPKNSAHPRYPEYIYPFDYGYLNNTSSQDEDGIDCWVGSQGGKEVTGMVTVIDPVKGDSEIKILLGCTEKDMNIILACHKRGDMDGLLMSRNIGS